MESNSSASHIFSERKDGIFCIRINRPEKKNALTLDMYSALVDAFIRGEEDECIRVFFIHGAGECFSSGNDLKDFINDPPVDESSPVFKFISAISTVKKPIVAAVHGHAVGIGTTMLLHCDLVYAGPGTRFHMPFIDLGLCPEGASSFLLPQLAGHQRAGELLLLGEPFSAEKARETGFVNRVVPDDVLVKTALEQAGKIAAKPPVSVRLTKELLKRAAARAVSETIAEESRVFVERLASAEAAEAFTAFFKKK